MWRLLVVKYSKIKKNIYDKWMHSLTFVDGRLIVGNLYECFETKYEGEYNGRYQSAESFQMTKELEVREMNVFI